MHNLNIIYEDNHIIVVEKKPNVLSQSDITGDIDLLTMVKEYIKIKYEKPGNVYVGLVHRLDRPVGGIMVFAKTSKAAKRLNVQIKKHEIKKEYVAVLNGKLEDKKGVLVNYLYKDEKNKKALVVDSNYKGAKEAILNYEVIGYYENNTVVKIDLVTGRYNQIRAQFANINYPLCGDQKYGKKDNKQIKLFAYKLTFIHPTTKEKLEFKLLPKWEEIRNEELIHRL